MLVFLFRRWEGSDVSHKTYCLWFLHTSLNTLFSPHSVFIHPSGSWRCSASPGHRRPSVLRCSGSRRPLTPPAELQTQLCPSADPRTWHHGPILAHLRSTTHVRKKVFTSLFNFLKLRDNMHSQYVWAITDANQGLVKTYGLRWRAMVTEGLPIIQKKRTNTEETHILYARKIWKHTIIVTYTCKEGWVGFYFGLLEARLAPTMMKQI